MLMPHILTCRRVGSWRPPGGTEPQLPTGVICSIVYPKLVPSVPCLTPLSPAAFPVIPAPPPPLPSSLWHWLQDDSHQNTSAGAFPARPYLEEVELSSLKRCVHVLTPGA